MCGRVGPLALVQSASGRGLGPAFRGLVSHRASITSTAVSFFSLSFMFGLGRVAGAVISCLPFFSLALGLLADAVFSCLRFSSFAFVGRSRLCGSFVFVFSCSSVSYSDHSFKLTMF